MNPPTWEDFHRLEARQKQLEEEMRKLKEQRTDEMKAINVNVASADVITHLNTLEQKIDTVQENTNRVTIQMEGARADILRLGESQADLRDKLKEHSEDLKAIKETQERHTEILGQLMNFGEETKSVQSDHTQRLDRIEVAMATKDDIKRIEATQEEILKLLRER